VSFQDPVKIFWSEIDFMILVLTACATLASFALAATRGQTINTNIQRALNYRINGPWSDAAELIGMYTGLYTSVSGGWSTPLDTNLIDNSAGAPAFYSSTQQSIYTVFSNPG
jgi:hypothetical protein